MIAVALSKDAVEPFIMRLTSGSAIVACINSPESVTISGDETAIFELESNLKANGIFARVLKVQNAYHSWHMKIIENHYIHAVKHVQASEGADGTLIFSSVTGQLVSGVDLGAAYWARNLVSPVIFSQAVNSLLRSPIARPDVLLEIGPHSVLQAPLKQILDAYHNSKARPASISILQRGKNAAMTALQAAGELWTRGYPIDLKKVNMDLIDQPQREPQVLNDLPPYPFNHSKSYWHESHLGRAHRFRQFGRRDLIGAPALDSTPFEPRWRGFIRMSENPWLLDHQVQNTVLYPAAGMIVMVLEAAQQLRDISLFIEGYEIRRMHVDKAMIIPTTAHGLETTLNLKLQQAIPGDISQSSSYEFSQYSKALDAPWQQNCHGILVIHYGADNKFGSFIKEEVDIGSFPASYKHLKELCTESIIPRQLYETLESIGIKYGPTFQNISWIQNHDNFSCSIVRIPDTSDRMPAKYEYPHLIHPATLDAMFQTVFVAGSEPMVPAFLEKIFISADLPQGAGYGFHGHSRATRKGLRDAVGTIVMSDRPDGKPQIVVKGLHFTALSTSTDDFSNARFLSNHQTLCAELVWKEWIGSAKVTTVVDWLDLAAHKKPDLKILDYRGAGSDNASPLLKILGRKSGTMPRFWRYTFATADPPMFDHQLNQTINDRNELIDYTKLSLDEDVTKQSLTEHAYDIVFAIADDHAHWTKLATLLKPVLGLVLSYRILPILKVRNNNPV
jgi:acyl transferase domain-containing protein